MPSVPLGDQYGKWASAWGKNVAPEAAAQQEGESYPRVRVQVLLAEELCCHAIFILVPLMGRCDLLSLCAAVTRSGRGLVSA